jgi:hypothetical protein
MRVGGAAAIIAAGIRWALARAKVLELPIGHPDYRARLNVLSEAEDALARACRWGSE